MIELMIVMVLLVMFFRIAIKGNKEYELRSRWGNVLMQTVPPLTVAINQCLKDRAGNRNACNTVDADKLGRYGISQMPVAHASEAYLLQHDASIQIIDTECTVNLMPMSRNETRWQIAISAVAESRFSTEDCQCVVYSRSPLKNYAFLQPPPENCASVSRLLF